MSADKPQLLNLKITQFGSEEEEKLAILLEGFTKQSEVDFVMEQFNKFMSDNATQVRN